MEEEKNNDNKSQETNQDNFDISDCQKSLDKNNNSDSLRNTTK